MGHLARGLLAILFVLVAAGCGQTRVIEKPVEVPVEIMVPVAVPDTSFRRQFADLMDDVLARPQSLDTLRVGATDSEILKAASIDLQYHRLLLRALKRFFVQINEAQ